MRTVAGPRVVVMLGLYTCCFSLGLGRPFAQEPFQFSSCARGMAAVSEVSALRLAETPCTQARYVSTYTELWLAVPRTCYKYCGHFVGDPHTNWAIGKVRCIPMAPAIGSRSGTNKLT